MYLSHARIRRVPRPPPFRPMMLSPFSLSQPDHSHLPVISRLSKMFASREPNAMLLSPQAQCRPYCHRLTSAFESCQRMDQARLTHQPLAFLHPFPSLPTRICQWLPNAACRRRRAATRSYSRPKRRADSHTALLPDARSDSGPQRAAERYARADNDRWMHGLWRRQTRRRRPGP